MATNEKKTRTTKALLAKEEAFGYASVDRACEILDMQKSAFKATVYKHADELKAFRFGGIIVVEMEALLAYRDKREAQLQEQNAKHEARSVEIAEMQKKRELREKLSTLSAEQIDILLGQLGA